MESTINKACNKNFSILVLIFNIVQFIVFVNYITKLLNLFARGFFMFGIVQRRFMNNSKSQFQFVLTFISSAFHSHIVYIFVRDVRITVITDGSLVEAPVTLDSTLQGIPTVHGNQNTLPCYRTSKVLRFKHKSMYSIHPVTYFLKH